MSRNRHRRVRTEPAPGADPSPQSFPDDAPLERPEPVLAGEDRLGTWGDDGLEVLPDSGSTANDERLEADRPPHYA